MKGIRERAGASFPCTAQLRANGVGPAPCAAYRYKPLGNDRYHGLTPCDTKLTRRPPHDAKTRRAPGKGKVTPAVACDGWAKETHASLQGPDLLNG